MWLSRTLKKRNIKNIWRRLLLFIINENGHQKCLNNLLTLQTWRWAIQFCTCYREFHHLVETLKQMNPNSRNRVLATWCFTLLFWPLRQYEWQIPQPTYWPEWFRHSWRGSDNPRKNKREANVNKLTPELSAHGGTKNKSRRYGTPAITYFYATGSLFIASDGDETADGKGSFYSPLCRLYGAWSAHII